MSNTIRIKTTPNGDDNYIKVNLEQEFDFIEILSLKISQDEAYTKFCSDYGVIVGRVNVNNGFGVPNAKVSVFLPIDENDKKDSEIRNLYPFETVNDKTEDGKRYNLLPKNPSPNNNCSTPIGTFPNKREVLDNPTMLEIYCKYYKFTTTTNYAGDFMLFGVPLGTYTLHVDADMSDIGIISQRPYDLIAQGTPEKMFVSPTKFKGGNNLDKLLQIKTANIGVNVQPFWGDSENCEIGITRLDIPLNFEVVPSAIFMGSIFGDNEKNSINRNCKPRNSMGELCQQVTGEGTIEMIRKTMDDDIERFDVEGGRVIDEDGTWAYQVPMNLDYMTTDEEGNLTFSQDPTVGIPTRASVRFRIGMDETGGEGRKRVRGKYLVPNNPSKKSEVDYLFGSAAENGGQPTKDSSFYDMYWNKIYTVKSFIPRFQRTAFTNGLPYVGNSYTGIKDVDNDTCTGTKTIFPYNRINTETNPMFSIICYIITIITVLISVLNLTLIPSLNGVIFGLRIMVRILNAFIGTIIFVINLLLPKKLEMDAAKYKITEPSYISCISIKSTCGNEDGKEIAFAPACPNICKVFNLNCDTDKKVDLTLGTGGGYYTLSQTEPIFETDGLSDCIAFQMAKSMSMFKFDFYNEWVNGSLYAYLLKYKKKRPNSQVGGRETFCEYDCDSFSSDDDYTGVDSNQNGTPDNSCGSQHLADTCLSSSYNSQNQGDDNDILEGLIKKVGRTLYYGSTTHYDSISTKNMLFATDIICLGSILESDWQGVPKLNNLLVPTTYKSVPAVAEKDIINGKEVVIESGMVELSNVIKKNNMPFLFFNVDCIGIHVPFKGCNNVRHICEFGVDIDEVTFGPNNLIIPPSGNIGSKNIDDDTGKLFRDYFYLINKDSKSPTAFSYPSKGVSSEFNINNKDEYDLVSLNDNGADYLDFKRYTPAISTAYIQPKNSYYFYFGLMNGKTALHKMNSRYFTECSKIIKDNLIIQSNTTPTKKNDSTGTITFSFIGGTAPIKYTVTGPNTSSNGVTESNTNVIIYNLGVGSYSIKGSDSLGNMVNKNITIYGPQPLSAHAYVSKNAKTTSSNDGEITIAYIINGVSPYTYTLKDANGNIVKGPITPATSDIIPNLPSLEPIGYTLIVSDSTGETIIIDKLIITSTPIVSGDITKTDSTCVDSNDGIINIKAKDGKTPYSFKTTGPDSFISTNASLSDLPIGTYTTVITDSSTPPQSSTFTTQISNINPKMTLTSGTEQQLGKQCYSDEYLISFTLDYEFNAPTSSNVEYLDINGNWVKLSVPYTNNATFMSIKIPKNSIGVDVSLRVAYQNNDPICYSNTITISRDSIKLPIIELHASISTTLKPDNSYEHTVYAAGGKGAITSSPYAMNTKIIDNLPKITTTLTDSVGCTKTISG
jgi:hypothetical protein